MRYIFRLIQSKFQTIRLGSIIGEVKRSETQPITQLAGISHPNLCKLSRQNYSSDRPRILTGVQPNICSFAMTRSFGQNRRHFGASAVQISPIFPLSSMHFALFVLWQYCQQPQCVCAALPQLLAAQDSAGALSRTTKGKTLISNQLARSRYHSTLRAF